MEELFNAWKNSTIIGIILTEILILLIALKILNVDMWIIFIPMALPTIITFFILLWKLLKGIWFEIILDYFRN